MNHHAPFVMFDRCGKCGEPRIVPAYVLPGPPPKPEPTCACYGDLTPADVREIGKAELFDAEVLDAHALFTAQQKEPLTAAEGILMVGVKLGELQASLLNGNPEKLLQSLVKIAAITRFVAVETTDIDEAFKLDAVLNHIETVEDLFLPDEDDDDARKKKKP